MLYPWGDARRFNSYASWCIRNYGSRLQKLSIDAGFSCPNRDGTRGTGGCTFCSNDGFNPSYCDPQKSITLQIEEGLGFHRTRYRRAVKFIAYFQAYSNTYAPLDVLKERYAEALSHPAIHGISIGTRPDCVDEEILDYLASLAEHHQVSIEYGVESCSNETLARVNRGHSIEQSVMAIEMSAARGLQTGAHFILGLPGESRQQMLEQTVLINKLPLNTVKFHQLQILKGTAMEQDYLHHPSDYQLFELEEYIEFVIDLLERLRPGLMIERLSGEVPPRYLTSLPWGSLRNDSVLRRIERRMEERNTFQGNVYKTEIEPGKEGGK